MKLFGKKSLKVKTIKSMKKLIGSVGFPCVLTGMSFAQNVGIAEPLPNIKLKSFRIKPQAIQ